MIYFQFYTINLVWMFYDLNVLKEGLCQSCFYWPLQSTCWLNMINVYFNIIIHLRINGFIVYKYPLGKMCCSL